ncbi:1,2-phenylacetyl-CoA epoxidase subunit PaaE [Entomomonas asaccharolytica]|uniref:Phenylacetate-CoA oxygenase/reductase subunit PaaK n=1 Tax=Entomomonas asaccharolytica TaxID=2785331 RepID=A0A974RXG3_9GAMM|nr:1,2-phenylacetyl-CoA epoxidase subunit PaaE [Entomomonas asaccharolytica]QQP86152.1 phenylacetate-CoA oxygenase/reductase subunit PaaK [Entomomonas asaccharolytica]
MKKKFHQLTVTDVRPETRDTVSIAFDVPEDLIDDFLFNPGQYLVLKKDIHGEDVRRSYSICSGLYDNELRVAVKKVTDGLFSTYANEQLKIGEVLEVMPPDGNFYIELDANRTANYLAIAAGSGITPILSIIKSTLEAEPNSTFTLVYGNRSTPNTIFREQLEDLKNTYLERLNLIFIFSREPQDIDLYNGHVDSEKCRIFFSRWIDLANTTAAFICGPQQMTEVVKQQLLDGGMSKENIHFELFATSAPQQNVRERSTVKSADRQMSQVTVVVDGRSQTIDLPRNTESILEAANKQGADLPFSCKAGVCSTCRAKVVAGEVEMDNNFALEDYEVAAGYVLSCQCYPLSDKVVLDYDQ